MAKASAPGRTKTRLVPPLTFEEAAALNTAFLRDITDNLLLAARHAAIVGYAAYAPPRSEGFFHRILPPAIGLIDASLPNFGDCLFRTIQEIFARGHGSAVVLNSDSPTLPTAFLVETANALARPGERAVLGPSSDGGYYLLGLQTAHRRLFDDIAWSTERVTGQTRGQVAAAGRAGRARERGARKNLSLLARHARQRRCPARSGGGLVTDRHGIRSQRECRRKTACFATDRNGTASPDCASRMQNRRRRSE
jgi:glycosyltransferase A (GT-A) superfamily protein (DUF2064 family)